MTDFRMIFDHADEQLRYDFHDVCKPFDLNFYYYCPTPINLRKSFDGLAGAVEEYIKQDPESGHVFAFFSRNKKLVKLLQWEDGGFVIWMKRLEQGGFHIPQSADGRIELTSRELAAILSGIKPQRYYKRYSKKS